MRNVGAIALVAASTLFTGCKKSIDKEDYYFPLVAGNEWNYDMTMSPSGDKSTAKMVVIGEDFEHDGKKYFSVVTTSDGESTTGYFRRSGDVVYQLTPVETEDDIVMKELVYLDRKGSEGDESSITETTDFASMTVTYKFVEEMKKLEVKGEKYKDIIHTRVKYIMDVPLLGLLNLEIYNMDFYFAKKFGLVKQTLEVGDLEELMGAPQKLKDQISAQIKAAEKAMVRADDDDKATYELSSYTLDMD